MANEFQNSWTEEHKNEYLENSYLEIGDTYSLDVNSPLSISAKPKDVPQNIVNLFMDENYLQFPTKHLLNMDLFPYQMSILKMLWTKRLPMVLAARGGAKTTMLAVYTILRALLNQGVKIVIAGAGLRQSGLVFEAMEQIWKNSPILQDISGKNNPPKRSVLGYSWEVGTSKVTGIPIGTGEKIRGLRANIIICDEFGSINPNIFETVIRGFAAVNSMNTFEKVREAYQVEALKSTGVSLEEDFGLGIKGNQIILSGTATYQFNHFYRYYQDYCNLIYSKGKIKDTGQQVDASSYAVIRIPYDHLPQGLMDKTVLQQGEITMGPSIFKMEYGCVFAKDSEGFFPASIIYGTTCPLSLPDGEEISFVSELVGDKNCHYVMGIDPAAERDNLAITIIKLGDDYRSHVYTWSANRKRFESDKKKNPKHYAGISDYNTFIIRKIHDLVSRFNIVRLNLDSGGGGRSIIEGLKDPTKIDEGGFCIYDIGDEEVEDKAGLHIIKTIEFSNRGWYESAHFNLLKDLTTRRHIFPEYDAVGIETDRVLGVKPSLMEDSSEDILGEIEECKYQTTLIQEQTTPKGLKKWDLPKTKGVITEKIGGQLKRDHFTSLLLANDAARDYLNCDQEEEEVYHSRGIALRNRASNTNDQNASMYSGRGMRKMKKSNYNKGGSSRSAKGNTGNSIGY
jgi:hypothetical protein